MQSVKKTLLDRALSHFVTPCLLAAFRLMQCCRFLVSFLPIHYFPSERVLKRVHSDDAWLCTPKKANSESTDVKRMLFLLLF
jgi:hypothetical protein